MKLITKRLKDLTLSARLRKLYDNLDILKQSLVQHGQIQPIVITADNVVVCGGRRYTAAVELSWEEIVCVQREDLTPEQKIAMEIDENVCREPLTWQEQILGYLHLFKIKKRACALKGEKWTHETFGNWVGKTRGRISQILPLAEYIEKNPNSPAATAESISAGTVAMLAEIELKAEQRLLFLRKSNQPTPGANNTTNNALKEAVENAEKTEIATGLIQPEIIEVDHILDDSEPAPQPKPKLVPTESQQRKPPLAMNVVGRRYTQGDSLKMLADLPVECIDGIYTDPPYGIDLDNITQTNTVPGHSEVFNAILENHDEEKALKTLQILPHLAFRVIRPKGFFIQWCDPEKFIFLANECVNAGFNVQRWPLIVVKPNARNQQANVNSTKNYEFLLVARKPGATLMQPMASSIYTSHEWGQARNNFEHPFSKPIDASKWILENFFSKNAFILDPFAGTGSIVFAGIKHGFYVYGIELEPDVYTRGEFRLQQAVELFILIQNKQSVIHEPADFGLLSDQVL
jgi:ParB-like chromosome segregation protein Spo0J/DNA modification methylase